MSTFPANQKEAFAFIWTLDINYKSPVISFVVVFSIRNGKFSQICMCMTEVRFSVT